jgi:hypothetical protein
MIRKNYFVFKNTEYFLLEKNHNVFFEKTHCRFAKRYQNPHLGELGQIYVKIPPGLGSMLWWQFSAIYDNFRQKIGLFLKNERYDKIFA